VRRPNDSNRQAGKDNSWKLERTVMAEKTVTIRIRIADYELEVQGPKKWAEETIKKFVKDIKKQQTQKNS